MTPAGVSPGGIVLADRNGRRFDAIVTERRKRELAVEPIDRSVKYYAVKAHEYRVIWHKRRAHNRHVAERQRPTA